VPDPLSPAQEKRGKEFLNFSTLALMLRDTCSLSLPLRLRRNRKTSAIRALVQETELSTSDLISPLFLIDGSNRKEPIVSMPQIFRYTLDLALVKIASLREQGVLSFALFPVLDPSLKSDDAAEAWNPNGLMARAIRAIKNRFPELCLIGDVALDPYTRHGHDGLVDCEGNILNDPTVEALIRMALSQAESGIDLIAPSDMMDGRIGALRSALDTHGFHNTGILSYSAKFASSLYGPFRSAVGSSLKFGDKKSYQLNPANSREALLEAKLDEEEGADILMVKPALFYLDIISKLRAQTLRPIAAYHVSGEYSMVMAAAGCLDPPQVFYEALLSIKRAGADMIFTYAVDQVLSLLPRL
jgi:porphobilinogen synthase